MESRMNDIHLEPPYYVAILTTLLSGEDLDGYAEAERKMLSLAEKSPGYIGRESARSADGRDHTMIYYEDEESLRIWRENPEHRKVQFMGRDVWYESYQVRIARVERAYGWAATRSGRDVPGS
jgi:heme-degrading monooxygenase HmoA